MGSLLEELSRNGLVSVKSVEETRATIFLQTEIGEAQKKKMVQGKEKRMEILNQTSSPDTFRREARKLLLDNPDTVQEVLNIAHAQGMHKKKGKGGTRLIANLYQVKEAIGKVNQADKTGVVNKLFPNK